MTRRERETEIDRMVLAAGGAGHRFAFEALDLSRLVVREVIAHAELPHLQQTGP